MVGKTQQQVIVQDGRSAEKVRTCEVVTTETGMKVILLPDELPVVNATHTAGQMVFMGVAGAVLLKVLIAALL